MNELDRLCQECNEARQELANTRELLELLRMRVESLEELLELWQMRVGALEKRFEQQQEQLARPPRVYADRK